MKIKEDIAREFDEFSKNYTEDMKGCVPYYMRLMSCFTSELDPDFKPSTILDLGCGNGNVTARLLQRFPEASFTLVDASKEMLSICKKNFLNKNITYLETYFNDLVLTNKSFDLVVAGFSLHHCKNHEKKELFRKIFNALNKNGIFMCSDLMISKNEPAHKSLVKRWKDFVNSNFKDGKKWNWLKQHYDQFDHPEYRVPAHDG